MWRASLASDTAGGAPSGRVLELHVRIDSRELEYLEKYGSTSHGPSGGGDRDD